MSATLRIRVYLEDTDAGGVVYHTGYLRFMERARTECLRSWGLEQSASFSESTSFVVARIDARFRSPAMLDDDLEVTSRVSHFTGARLIFEQQVIGVSSRVVHCAAQVEVAAIDLLSKRPKRLPRQLLSVIEAAGDG